MTLSKETLEKIADVENYSEMLRQALNELAKLVEKDTDEVFSICTQPYVMIQLYHNNRSKEEALEVLKEIADDGNVVKKWEDDKDTCYEMAIDRHSACVLLDNRLLSQ